MDLSNFDNVPSSGSASSASLFHPAEFGSAENTEGLCLNLFSKVASRVGKSGGGEDATDDHEQESREDEK
jgi:hypothetical protein